MEHNVVNLGGGSREFFVLFLQLLCTLGLVKKKKLLNTLEWSILKWLKW